MKTIEVIDAKLTRIEKNADRLAKLLDRMNAEDKTLAVAEEKEDNKRNGK
jgi:hypothetical protein